MCIRDRGTPVPIPNTVVKLIYGDNTWLATAREDNSTRTRKSSLYLSLIHILIWTMFWVRQSSRLTQAHTFWMSTSVFRAWMSRP